MLPSLRLGFVVAPEWALPSLIAAKNCLDWHCPTPLQTMVAAFIGEGHLARHVRKMRQVYQQRRDLLLGLLRGKFAQLLEPIESSYGMHIGAFARGDVDAERVAERLARRNVKLHSLSRYYLGRETRPGLVFGYGAVDLADIRRGMEALSEALSPADT
jgi:GntR family transcriptional regulator/MocR family aminotransferase